MKFRFFAPILLAPALLEPVPPAASADLSEPARWLRDYLKIDTTNPPGGEHRAAAWLAETLHREGIATRLLVTPEGRTSLYARLSAPAGANRGGQALLLLHHIDVVPAGPGWTVPPFGGVVREGRLWGRGAVDDKSLGIAQLAAFVDLKRRKAPLERDVIYLAVADEENGGLRGTGWLLRQYPELFQGVEAVLGEGGRGQVDAGGRIAWWGVEVAQKRPLWIEVAVAGRAGHGSGLNPHSANHKLVQGLARVLSLPPRWRVTAPARDFLQALGPLENDRWRDVFARIDEVVEASGPKEFLMPGMANLFLDTVQLTVLEGGERINVIPARARAQLDVRLLPDTDADAFLAGLREALGEGFDVRVLLTSPPAPASPPKGRFYRSLEETLGREAPVVPLFIPGFTDSRFFRERGIPAYGVSPFAFPLGEPLGIHGPDERIPLAELDRGVERLRRLVARYAAPASP
jgi:acetylornithine deacetylase/succinyl-diaminopimelate desuccinylase-like protein